FYVYNSTLTTRHTLAPTLLAYPTLFRSHFSQSIEPAPERLPYPVREHLVRRGEESPEHREEGDGQSEAGGVRCRGPKHRQRQRSDRKSTRLNSSHGSISYAVFCLKKKNT